jgi:glycosyltransferase involved in cell wall biosynthesis
MPAYNEMATLEEILSRVQAVGIDKEIIVVDDGSTDVLAACSAIGIRSVIEIVRHALGRSEVTPCDQ